VNDLVGTVLDDRYRLESLLGEGGMGFVYKGRHEFTGREVAIKILLPEYTNNTEVVERFYREAKAATAIGSEHICQVLDMRPQHLGTPYLVMEYLEGETLKDRIRRTGPLPPTLAVAIFTQILEGLGAAHDARIIHRDVKPENVYLVMRPEGPPLVKLLDFGISKFTDDSADHALTRVGTILGSPYYMSPEQANGETKVGPLSDLYSVGVMLHEALTGAVPFDAPTFSALVIKIVTEAPPHPSDLDPRIPRELGNLVLRAMARRPTDRFRSAREIAAALANLPLPPEAPARDIPSTLIPARRKISDAPSPPFAGPVPLSDPDFPPAGAVGLGGPPPTQIASSQEHPSGPPADQVGLPEAVLPAAKDGEEERPTDPAGMVGRAAKPSPASSHAPDGRTEQVQQILPSDAQEVSSVSYQHAEASHPSYQLAEASHPSYQLGETSHPSYQVTETSSPSVSLQQSGVGLEGSSASFIVVKEDVRTPMGWTHDEGEKKEPRKLLPIVGVGALLFALFAASGIAVVMIGMPLMEQRAPAPPPPLTRGAPTGAEAPSDAGLGDGVPTAVAHVGMGDGGGDAGIDVADDAAGDAAGDASPEDDAEAAGAAADGAATPVGATMRVVIRASPESATIFLNGREVEGNPAELTLPADGAVHEVEARARGHRTATSRFTADEDREVVLTLAPRPRPTKQPSKVHPGPLINPW